MRYRVIIADDNPDLRGVLVEVLSTEPELHVIGTADDTDSAIELACAEHPDVAVIDVKMPGGGGLRVAREIARCSPETRTIVLSAYEDRSTVLEMLRAGAVGYLVKGTSPEKIIEAVKRVVRGQSSLSAEVMGDVVHELSTHLQREGERTDEERIQLDRITHVLEGEGLSMTFQPIVDLHDRSVVGVEALARFAAQPRRPPNLWFAEAASVGLGIELELHAVRIAIEDAARLPDDMYLSLNLSHWTVQSGLVVESLGSFPPDRVVVEITEHERIEDYDVLDEALDGLRARSVRLAIDDAGAGFASLRHTLLLAPDIIKLDISITQGVDRDRGRRALASALISFADEMGMSVTAEGVETEAELETLLELGAGFGQGFLLGRPGRLHNTDGHKER
jgi:EAL domain-containing protein (putative c-di-GMP-specific phosphodiesterase class I)/CheY-like chemotaxis protein